MKRFTNFVMAAVFLLPFASGQEEGGWKSTDGYSLREIRGLTGTSASGGNAIDLEAAPMAARSLGAEPASAAAMSQSSFATAPTPVVAGNFADQITPEIQALARGLQYDPLNIFHFVRNRVAYECYYGSKKGAHLTLMEMGGNDYDQSSLLIALLRASGYPATYVSSPVSFTYQYLSSATGIENPYAHLDDAAFAAEVSTPEDPVLATDPGLVRTEMPRRFSW